MLWSCTQKASISNWILETLFAFLISLKTIILLNKFQSPHMSTRFLSTIDWNSTIIILSPSDSIYILLTNCTILGSWFRTRFLLTAFATKTLQIKNFPISPHQGDSNVFQDRLPYHQHHQRVSITLLNRSSFLDP